MRHASFEIRHAAEGDFFPLMQCHLRSFAPERGEAMMNALGISTQLRSRSRQWPFHRTEKRVAGFAKHLLTASLELAAKAGFEYAVAETTGVAPKPYVENWDLTPCTHCVTGNTSF